MKFVSGEGRAPKDGGSYRPLRNQLSLKEFEEKFQALHNFESRRASVLNSYLASASKKDRAVSQVEAQLTKDQSAYLLNDPVYIDEHGGTAGAGTGLEQRLSRVGGLGSRKQSDALPSIVSSSRNVFEQLLVPVEPVYQTLDLSAQGGALKIQSPSSNGLFAQNIGSNQSVASVGQALDQLDGMSAHPSTRSFHDPPMSLNPLIRGMKAGQVGGSFHRRHASVAPRFMDKADERALYFSPSRMQLGLRDAIFQGGASNGDQLTSS